MNEAQKKIMIAVAIGLVITFLFPPHAFGDRAIRMGYAFIANIPQYASVYMPILFAEWMGIAVIGGIFYLIAKSHSTETEAVNEQWHNQKQRDIPISLSKGSKGSVPIYSWRRYFARTIDLNIASILIILAFVLWKATGHYQLQKQLFDMLVNPETAPVVKVWFWGLFSCLLWVVVEPIILSNFGTTPGKALFRLRLVSDNNEPNYVGRSVAVWAAGMGFGLPILSPLVALIAGARLKTKGKADWDRWTGFSVEGESLSISRTIALTALMLLLFTGFVSALQPTGLIASTATPSQEPMQQVHAVQNTQQTAPSSANSAYDIAQHANDLYSQGRYAEALPLVLQLAEQNNSSWQGLLGYMYYQGQGVAPNNNQAFYWYKKAAEQGDVNAQYSLGVIYNEQQCVTKGCPIAVYWFRKAADQGDVNAQNSLGFIYNQGQGVTQDNNQAMYWYKKAAEQGDINAKAALNNLIGEEKKTTPHKVQPLPSQAQQTRSSNTDGYVPPKIPGDTNNDGILSGNEQYLRDN